jgi:hypothetical protein
MDFNEFFEKVTEIKSKQPIWFGLESDAIATDKEINHAEMSLSVLFPDEYKQFVKTFGGGYFAFTTVYSVGQNSEWDIILKNKNCELIKSHNFLAFSDNHSGDYYGFKTSLGLCDSKIYFYDHETQQIKKTDFKNIFEFILKIGLQAN